MYAILHIYTAPHFKIIFFYVYQYYYINTHGTIVKYNITHTETRVHRVFLLLSYHLINIYSTYTATILYYLFFYFYTARKTEKRLSAKQIYHTTR